NKRLEKRLDSHGARLYTLEQLNIPHQVSKVIDEVVTDAVDWAMQVPLRNRFRDLPEADMKEILHQRMWETDSYKSHKDHMQLYEALEKSMNRNHSENSQKIWLKHLRRRRKVKVTKNATWVSTSSATSTSFTNRLSISMTPVDLQMDDDMAPDEQAQSSDDEDIRNAHFTKVNLRQDWWKPLEEERPATPEPAWLILSSDVPVPTNNWASALASNYSPTPKDSLLPQTGDIAMFMDWLCKRRGITELKPQDLEGLAFEIIKVFHPDVIHLQYQMEECHKLLTDSVDDSILRHNVSKPFPLGGLPGQVIIQSDFFFNKDLEYLRYSSKGSRPAMSISKMKVAYYPDVGLEQMVPDHIWIEEECKYDIAAMYSISHWWFQRQRFYIDRHTYEGDRKAVRTHIRILSVVRIKVFSMYGYDYMKKIVLCRANLNEHVIAERDFKYLYLSDFEDLYLLNLQGHLNHLPPKDKKILTIVVNLWTRHLVIRQQVEDFQLGIESYQTQLNLTKPRWDATGFEYKNDYTVIDSPRAVTFRDRYGVQMIMRFNDIQKFSDGMLQQIDEALDYPVKELKINKMNPCLNTRGKSVSARSDIHNQRSHSRFKEALLESEGSRCGHWKSRSKKKKSSGEEDDLSHPWVCEEIDPFTPRIRYFNFPKTRMPSHIKTYNRTLKHEQKKSFPPWKQQEGSQKKIFKKGSFQNQQRPKRKQDRITLLTKTLKEIFVLDKATTPLIGFNNEIIWPIRKIKLLVKIRDEEHSTSAWMNFVVVRLPSLNNGIIGRPGVRKLQAVLSIAHEMVKLSVEGGVITRKSSRMVPLECTMPADMTGVSRHIAKHCLNVRKGCSPIRQKKKRQAADRNQAIQEEVRKLVKSRIMKEVHYHDGLSNPMMKSKFHWTTEAEEAFKQMKKLIAELPMLATPMEKEELIVYLAATKETANVGSGLIANQVNETYIVKEADMIRYLEKLRILTSSFKAFSIRQQVLVEEVKEKSISEVEILAVVEEEEEDTWMTPIFEYFTEETLPANVKRERAVRRKSQRFVILNETLYKKILPWTMAMMCSATSSKQCSERDT
nr:hypothetical protein [Tanacetum cinerariifolium]